MHMTGRLALRAAPALALALTALALPAAASANDQFCYGKTTQIPATTERDTGSAYEFVCREPVKAFALSTTVPTFSFDASADVFDPPENGGGIRGDDRFGECEGEIPAHGFSCTGTYNGFGRIVRGTFDTKDAACTRDRSGRAAMRTSLTVLNTDGKLSTYPLGRPQGCPARVKTTKARKARRAGRRG